MRQFQDIRNDTEEVIEQVQLSSSDNQIKKFQVVAICLLAQAVSSVAEAMLRNKQEQSTGTEVKSGDDAVYKSVLAKRAQKNAKS